MKMRKVGQEMGKTGQKVGQEMGEAGWEGRMGGYLHSTQSCIPFHGSPCRRALMSDDRRGPCKGSGSTGSLTRPSTPTGCGGPLRQRASFAHQGAPKRITDYIGIEPGWG